ncbi:MAG: spore germination protein, partial [Tissierellia bacterium]|nr:spore germination protein [Tissierellia bacterium]
MLVSKNLQENIQIIKDTLRDCDDVVYRNIEIGKDKTRASIIFIDGLVDKIVISEFAIESLLNTEDLKSNLGNIKANIAENASLQHLAIHDVKEEEDLNKVVDAILFGETVLLIDGADKALIM